jgi:hypothetical protein
MEALYHSKMSIDFQPIRRYIPEDRNLRNHSHENLKSYMLSVAQGTASNGRMKGNESVTGQAMKGSTRDLN